MEIYRKFFGKKLRDALANAGLNQTQFAEKLNVEPPTVSRWVNGHDFPGDERLPQILEVLGVTEDYFLTVEQKAAPSVNSLLKALGDLQHENQTLKDASDLPRDLIELWKKSTESDHALVLNLLRTKYGEKKKKDAK